MCTAWGGERGPVVWRGMAWYDVVWRGMVWRGEERARIVVVREWTMAIMTRGGVTMAHLMQSP